jgi:S-adenosylmethionine synthetase
MIRTAECVSPMHPDKMCDRISDTLLDLHLTHDPNSRVAIETAGGNGLVYVTGEVTSEYKITEDEITQVVRDVTTDDTIKVIINLNQQSPEIAQGVDVGGAGDQGIMTGYACRENEQLLPQEYFLARELNKFIFQKFPFDGKTQITLGQTQSGREWIRVVASFQKAPTTELYTLVTEFFRGYPKYTLEEIHINPAGPWNIGGFTADAGLTGRKLAVDNYGPRIPIGGGAFSGKDSTKVDRSAAYMARRVAVDILEQRPEVNEVFVQLAYAIGYDQPLQATAVVDGKEEKIQGYDLSPSGIIDFLKLRKPIFANTAQFGHMGADFSWK